MAGDEEKKEESPEETITSAKDYFAQMGLNPNVDKNSFSDQDAIATMEKAISVLKARKQNRETAKVIIRQAWGIFKILA